MKFLVVFISFLFFNGSSRQELNGKLKVRCGVNQEWKLSTRSCKSFEKQQDGCCVAAS